jgi:hypothetical protein
LTLVKNAENAISVTREGACPRSHKCSIINSDNVVDHALCFQIADNFTLFTKNVYYSSFINNILHSLTPLWAKIARRASDTIFFFGHVKMAVICTRFTRIFVRSFRSIWTVISSRTWETVVRWLVFRTVITFHTFFAFWQASFRSIASGCTWFGPRRAYKINSPFVILAQYSSQLRSIQGRFRCQFDRFLNLFSYSSYN